MQHIGKILAKGNRIIWIGSLGLRKPKAKISDVKRIFEKFGKLLNHKNNSDEDGVVQLHPLIIPFHDIRVFRKINCRLLKAKIQKVIIDNNFKNPILLTSTPIIGDLINTLKLSSSHYFCLDDYSLFEGAFKSLIKLEKDLLKVVDSSFGTSDILFKTRMPKSGKSYFLPQGVDFQHFNNVTANIPARVNSIKHPVIGYFGLLAEYVDVELITKCAANYLDYTFLLIGKTRISVSQFSNYPNIIYLGEIQFSELPKYAKIFDVGIIPFIINELTVAVNPLKLLEYMALGIPVVSTNLPEVYKFKELNFIAKSEDEFINLIEKAVHDNKPEKAEERKSIAEKFSWDSITNMISDKIISIEEEKNKL